MLLSIKPGMNNSTEKNNSGFKTSEDVKKKKGVGNFTDPRGENYI